VGGIGNVYGLGLNWFPLSGVAVLINYAHQIFAAAGGAPARRNEDAQTIRVQIVL
jgi:hypothetical protein